MQYSTLRISTLVAVFSASTALAYLDCGGGRAPPKTTVPGCPGYVGPTVVDSTLATSTVAPVTTSIVVPVITTSSAVPIVTATSTPSSSDDINYDNYLSDSGISYTGDNDGLCICSGYLCEFAQPGCVSVNTDTGASSTITANPGWETKSFDPEAYLSYIATAGPGMTYSADGYVVSFDSPATELLSLAYASSTVSAGHTTKTSYASASGTTDSFPTATGTASSLNSTSASTLPTVSSTASSNTTVATPSQSVVVATTNGSSKTTAFGSLAALMVFGVSAMALL